MGQSVFLRSQDSSRRVVVTGLGLITPVGLNTRENWQALTEGRSGISEITAFNAQDFPVRCAGEVKNFDSNKILEKKDQKKMDRFIMLSLEATRQAL